MADLDPRITVMPDGSYFYSGSLVKGGGNVSPTSGTDNFYRKVSGAWRSKSPGFSERMFNKYERVDVTSEHLSYYRFDHDGDIRAVRKKSDISLKDCAAKYLEDPESCKISHTRRVWKIRNIDKSGYGIMVLKIRKFNTANPRSFQIDYNNFNDTLYALVPYKDGTANYNKALFLSVFLDMTEDEIEHWMWESHAVEDSWYENAPMPVLRFIAHDMRIARQQMKWDCLDLKTILKDLVLDEKQETFYYVPCQAGNYCMGWNWRFRCRILSNGHWRGLNR